ncbi:MAG TPA: lactate utilization protein [Pyrinomonadaceae bacterium]|nr:lactate utilization protein [Pyrinomonadaceae bacterium]
MTGARTAIFSLIRGNLAASAPFDAEHHYEQAVTLARSGSEAASVLETFALSLEAVGASCAIVDSESAAADRLREIVTALAAKEIVISDAPLVHRLIDAAGLDAVAEPSRKELFASDLGVTTAQWAIAETGTLVLEAGAERHRLVSLVPPVHVCVLNASAIRQSMGEILEKLDVDANPAITFITGASRTSDIELTLAIGVHGPGELYVIVIKDQTAASV